MELSNIRKNFGLHRLIESNLPDNPFVLLKSWLKDIAKLKVPDFNAMVLSTVGKNNTPASRVVLLKDITEQGQLTFFTNYKSRKGNEISENNHVAVNFFWPAMERQIRIEGTVKKLSRNKSQLYFDSRPLESRISAILSPQSQKIKNLDELRLKAKEMMKSQHNITIPENWGGYSVSPEYFEFWQGGEDRLHDRLAYSLRNNNWKIERLAP